MKESELLKAYGVRLFDPVDEALRKCQTSGCPAYVLSNLDRYCDRHADRREQKRPKT